MLEGDCVRVGWLCRCVSWRERQVEDEGRVEMEKRKSEGVVDVREVLCFVKVVVKRRGAQNYVLDQPNQVFDVGVTDG